MNKALLAIPLLLVMLASTPAVNSNNYSNTHLPREAPAASTAGAFSFVSNFESGTLEGWSIVQGTAIVTTKVNYFGEPSLASKAQNGKVQIDIANKNFVTGDSFISFQVVINTQKGNGFFGLYTLQAKPVAVVGVSDGYVYAGTSPTNAVKIESVPLSSAYPNGWVYIAANVYDASTPSSPNAGWVMQVFVDRTDQVAATVNVPYASSYSGAIIETLSGTVYYTNIVVSTYEIPIYIAGYNNMEGYGQGSGLLVNLLPAFYNLTAEMKLNSWSTPQNGILSFQINAMNYYGTTTSSCVGFFQLGVDLNPNSYISPWYVPGKNCFAYYFLPSQNPAVEPGFYSPPGTLLILSIVYYPSQNQITFTIKDLNTSAVYTASIPYNGTAFYGSYTQLEFQPCCNTSPIQDYKINAELYSMQITTLLGNQEFLNASYMLPFTLDAPPSWDFTYYQNSTYGYTQISQ
ncbi:MAG: hypothetical protein QXQ39_00010 [Conexivisphaerales archaeon]